MLRKVVLALMVMGILSAFGLAQTDDGSVPWPGPSECVWKELFSSGEELGAAPEFDPAPAFLDPNCFRACMKWCCLTFWWQPWKCFTVCPAFCTLVCSYPYWWM